MIPLLLVELLPWVRVVQRNGVKNRGDVGAQRFNGGLQKGLRLGKEGQKGQECHQLSGIGYLDEGAYLWHKIIRVSLQGSREQVNPGQLVLSDRPIAQEAIGAGRAAFLNCYPGAGYLTANQAIGQEQFLSRGVLNNPVDPLFEPL